jgi:hypothetical protein
MDDLLSSNGPLGDAARSIRNTHQSSGQIGGILPSSSKEQCYEQLDNLYYSWFSEVETGEIYSSIYSRTKLTNDNIEGTLDLAPNKDYFYGLTSSAGLEVRSYSPDTAVHLKSNCSDYLDLNESEIKTIDMPYPNFKKGKRTDIINIETKECRVTNVSIGDLAYEIIACPGDDSIYTRFLSEENRVVGPN